MDGEAGPQDAPREPAPDAVATVAGVAQPGSIDCRACGVVMPAGSRYCLGCGARLGVPAGPEPPPAPPPPAPPPAPPAAQSPAPAPFTAGTGAGTPAGRNFAFGPEPRGPAQWLRTPWAVVAAVVVAVGVVAALTSGGDDAGGGGSSSEPTTYHLTGTLSAPTCDGGYNIEYASIYVRNQSDELIGSGTTTGNLSSSEYGCEVSFGVDVPKATFYTVRIGSHDGPAYSFEEMTANGWSVSLSLGG
jgi:hypothetical protein